MYNPNMGRQAARAPMGGTRKKIEMRENKGVVFNHRRHIVIKEANINQGGNINRQRQDMLSVEGK